MKLKDYLKENNITTSEFAALAGLTQGYISLVCNGKRRPSADVALRIKHASGKKVSVLELLYPEVEPDSELFAQEAASPN